MFSKNYRVTWDLDEKKEKQWEVVGSEQREKVFCIIWQTNIWTSILILNWECKLEIMENWDDFVPGILKLRIAYRIGHQFRTKMENMRRIELCTDRFIEYSGVAVLFEENHYWHTFLKKVYMINDFSYKNGSFISKSLVIRWQQIKESSKAIFELKQSFTVYKTRRLFPQNWL